MSKPTKRLFVVVRCGPIDELDAIDEVEKMIARKGSCWFGKYGQPLYRRLEEIVERGIEDVVAVLIRKATAAESSKYYYRMFRLRKLTRKAPADANNVPQYYRKTLWRISSWLLLEPYKGRTPSIDDLVTKSSLQPLVASLGTSMRGHFFCKLRSGD